ncbi:tetratricopeptide repeat protein [Paraburkholderia sp. MPAMCS5]|uniref:tetratricopeptide repeat protein n=1 Tax=Paraburkholderia sp. MPAMCS5 TaxID=3112563 RepID=UPI002E1770AF|nr:tetratricopeptide repeat protein [Paraburkholderia sp. MPAMCS5]
MKRASVHLVFASVALCCAGVAVYDWVQWRRAEQVNQTVAAVVVANATTAKQNSPDVRGRDEAPRVRLARAIALSRRGAYDAAGPLFESLIRDESGNEVGRAALFDLGNLYLRQGIGHGSSGAIQSLAMVEEAKARYRTLLRIAPDDWDARYNLERALWLAPETRSASGAPDVKEQHNIKVRDPESKDLP